MKDTYKTIDIPPEETLFKEKGSKFFGYAFPILNEDEVKLALARLKKSIITQGIFVMLGN